MIPDDELIATSDAQLDMLLAHYRGIKVFWDDADRANVAALIAQLQGEVELCAALEREP